MIAALILLPIVAGALVYALPRNADAAAKWAGFVVAAVTFVLTIAAAGAPDESIVWLSRPFASAFHVGANGFGYWIALLLALVTACAFAAMRVPRQRDFTAQLLFLEGAMMGVFLAKDLLLFALFWDLMLIPVFIAMVGWNAHAHSAWRYLIYNITAGLALLLATAAFGIAYGSTDVIGKTGVTPLGDFWAPWILAGFAIAFLVKTPVWPFHTWMPDTYADSLPPLAAVVSSVQSKAGLYGFVVIGLPLFARAMHQIAPVMIVLGLISLLYGAYIALVQSDAKRIVAYSSLSHLGLILLAIFSFDEVALRGAIIYIVAHGLFSAALFLVLGYVEVREETRDVERLGGLGGENPRLAGALMIASLAALGLPGLCGFTGEVVILTGIFRAGLVLPAFIALVPIVLAAGYMLRLFQRIMHGPKNADLPRRADLGLVEGLALVPLVAGFVFLGIDPQPITTLNEPALQSLHSGQQVSYESVSDR